MNAVHEETTYRCINPACTRATPRPVAFCPYCGTAQGAAAAPPTPPADDAAQRVAAATAGASAAASLAGWADAPQGEEAVPAAQAPARPLPPAPPVPPVPPAPPAPPVTTAAPDTAFGHSSRASATPAPAPEAPPGRSGPSHIWGGGPAAAPPSPPGREPIKLRWWLAILLLLWGVWMWAKPSAHKTERRIEHAVALAHACKAREAQDELIALRADHATSEQLEQLQQSLNDEAAACTRKRQHDKAWRETGDAVDAALATPTDASIERARSRLQAFTRRWGEDAQTRALRGRIDEASHPLAAPSAEPGDAGQ